MESYDTLNKKSWAEYDPAGNVKKSRDPNGVGFDAVYDILSRMTSQEDTFADETSTEYDKAGNVVAQTDAKSNTTTTVYDVLGRTKGVTDRLTNETAYTYDLAGRMTSIIDAQSKTTSYTYNALGAKTEETYPDHTGGSSGDATYGKVKFTYDPAGRMIRREDQKGDTVTFNHTMAGTITSRNYRTKANSPSGTIADTDTFTFDAMGRMLTAVSGRYTNTVTMTYDNYGRLDDESLTIASQTYTVSRSYDSRGRLSELTYPNGSVVERTYTDRSQLHTVDYLGSTVDTRTYDDGGRLSTSTYANGAVITFSYRNDNLLSSIATSHAGSPNIGTYSYSWDENKNKTGETISGTMSGFGFSTGSTGYDDEDRLTAWERIDTNLDQAWTLSAVGNWSSFSSDSSTWSRSHSDAHEFTGFTGTSSGSLTYDAKGNQTSRPSTLSAPALNLEWNFDNQLIGADINGSSGSLEVNFEYDALGRRVARSRDKGAEVVYVHAGQQVIADYDRGTAASTPTYRYVYADYVDEPILRHSGTGTTLPGSGDAALFYHRNQQYSIVGLTNAAGTLVERYSYSAYGTLGIYDASGTVRTNSTYANRYTYTGREWDHDLKLYHFRARWYDPSTGGFISRDPLGYVDGMSLYRGYFGTNGMDPYGKLSRTTQQDPVVAQGRGPTGETVAIYSGSEGCYVIENSVKIEVQCPMPKSLLMMKEGEEDLQGPATIAQHDIRKSRFLYNEHYLMDDSNPNDVFNRISQEQIGGICGHKSYNCIAVLHVLTHGSANDTFDGSIDYDQIDEFYGSLIYCRPCFIVLNSCCTGARTKAGTIYAARLAIVTGCTVFAPKHCLRGFFGGAKTKLYTGEREGNPIPYDDPRNKTLGTGAEGCFKLFGPDGNCRYNPFGPLDE